MKVINASLSSINLLNEKCGTVIPLVLSNQYC